MGTIHNAVMILLLVAECNDTQESARDYLHERKMSALDLAEVVRSARKGKSYRRPQFPKRLKGL